MYNTLGFPISRPPSVGMLKLARPMSVSPGLAGSYLQRASSEHLLKHAVPSEITSRKDMCTGLNSVSYTNRIHQINLQIRFPVQMTALFSTQNPRVCC